MQVQAARKSCAVGSLIACIDRIVLINMNPDENCAGIKLGEGK